jgi:glycosyltransferase involved in cell wall biosynthesis
MDAFIKENYARACTRQSDINEHVPTLAHYAEQCNTVCEFGVRSGVSTWGFADGLLAKARQGQSVRLDGYDLDAAPEAYKQLMAADKLGIQVAFHQENDLEIAPVTCDLLFIDTFHVYGQLKRELALHASGVNKFIIMHDTTVDELEGEVIRAGWDAATYAKITGIPASELLVGLWPAVSEFLTAHPEWILRTRYTNNNGLTVLERVEGGLPPEIKLLPNVTPELAAVSKPTLCLNMIVKNEAAIIKKTLTNLASYFSFQYWVICDTGSTDGTQDIIRAFFAECDIPGELHDCPWVNFGHNRTEALELAYNKTDYLLIFDADDEMSGTLILPPLTADSYRFRLGSETFQWCRPLLINNRKRFVFRAVLHEYLEAIEPVGPAVLVEGSYIVLTGTSGSRSKDPEKYLKDALMLKDAYETESNIGLKARYAFYCAQGYKDYGQTENAIEWYKKVVDSNDNWAQERYYSCLQLGKLYETKLNNIINALQYYIKARTFDEERIEGHAFAMTLLRHHDLHAFVVTLAKEVMGYRKPSADKLFVFTEQYNDVIEFNCSISAYYTKDRALGYECCQRVLANNTASASIIATSLANIKFYE